MKDKALQYAVQARAHGYSAEVLTWSAALDNYEPTRAYAAGYAVKYAGTLVREDGSRAEYPTAGIMMLCEDTQLPLGNLLNAVALFDYGSVVYPYYLAGWNDRDADHWGVRNYVLWHPFPVAQDGEMTHHDPPQRLDYRNWQLGPRKAYHFKTARYCEHDAPAVVSHMCECGYVMPGGNPRALGQYDNGPVTPA